MARLSNRKIDLKRWYRIEPWSRSWVLKSTIRSLTSDATASHSITQACGDPIGRSLDKTTFMATLLVISDGRERGSLLAPVVCHIFYCKQSTRRTDRPVTQLSFMPLWTMNRWRSVGPWCVARVMGLAVSSGYSLRPVSITHQHGLFRLERCIANASFRQFFFFYNHRI